MMSKLPLTERKLKWARNRDVTLRGKRLNYNAALQQKYIRSLKKLVKDMTDGVKKDILKLFHGDLADDYFEHQEEVMAMDASFGSRARILMNALMKKYTLLFDKNARILSNKMVDETLKLSEINLKSSLKQLSGGLSLKTGLVPEGMTDVISATIAENVSLIRSIPEEYFKQITGSVMRSITTGRGLADLEPEISKYAGQTERRAKNIALDQTRKAFNSVNKQRMQAIGVKQFEWVHSGSSQRPRDSHIKINGEIFSFDNLYQEQARLGVPESDRGMPSEPPFCFVGSTQVSLANGCVNIWRYRHVGDVVTIHTDGCSFTSTVNHPILTQRGWLPAHKVEEGDYLASSMVDNGGIVDHEEANNHPTFDEVFDSIRGERRTEAHEAFNFHGDIPEYDVDRIRVANKLSNRIETIDSEQIEKLSLTLANAFPEKVFSGSNPKITHLCGTRSSRQVSSFVGGEPLHPDFVGFGAVSQDNAIILQDSRNDISSAIPVLAKLQSANASVVTVDYISGMGVNISSFPGGRANVIEPDFKRSGEMTSASFSEGAEIPESHSAIKRFLRVNKKVVSKFDGHVYTMESENGWYSVSPTEIISKNCRCTMIPVIKFDDE